MRQTSNETLSGSLPVNYYQIASLHRASQVLPASMCACGLKASGPTQVVGLHGRGSHFDEEELRANLVEAARTARSRPTNLVAVVHESQVPSTLEILAPIAEVTPRSGPLAAAVRARHDLCSQIRSCSSRRPPS
eukprot:7379961-Prymnesium_polylepis.2